MTENEKTALLENDAVEKALNDWIKNDVDDYDKIAIEAYLAYYGTPETTEDLDALQSWVGRGCYYYYGDGEEDEIVESDEFNSVYIAYSDLLGGPFYGYVVWKD